MPLSIDDLILEYGTSASGNWGHVGVPGQRGGSNQTSGATGDRADRIRAANKAAQQKYQAPIKAARAEARAKAKAEKDAQGGGSSEDAAKKKADEEAKAEAAKPLEDTSDFGNDGTATDKQKNYLTSLTGHEAAEDAEPVDATEWYKGDTKAVWARNYASTETESVVRNSNAIRAEKWPAKHSITVGRDLTIAARKWAETKVKSPLSRGGASRFIDSLKNKGMTQTFVNAHGGDTPSGLVRIINKVSSAHVRVIREPTEDYEGEIGPI
jgi:hypothetical protein